MKKRFTLLVSTVLLVGIMANAQRQTITPNGDTINWYVNSDSASATITRIVPPPAGSFTIPDSVVWHDTAYVVTGLWNTFQGCTSLTSVNIPEGVKSIRGAFKGCTSLRSIHLPNTIEDMGSAFVNCTSLAEVNIPDSVRDITNAFRGCTSLRSAHLPNTVRYMMETFRGCTSLVSVNIPNSVIDISSAFYGCSSLTTMQVPNNVASISGAFANCTSLVSVALPNNLTMIGDSTFTNCINLADIAIPENTKSIQRGAFHNCRSLTQLHIPDSTTYIRDGAFYGCSGLRSISVSEGNPRYDSRNNCNAIIETLIPATDSTPASTCIVLGCINTTFPNDVHFLALAFAGNTSITSMVLPNHISGIGSGMWGGTFEGCSNLVSITLPDSLRTIGAYTFLDCTSLTSITIPDSVSEIGQWAFQNCPSLTQLTVSPNNPYYDSRQGCNAIIKTETNTLTHACASTFIPSSVESIDPTTQPFTRCAGLTSIIVPELTTYRSYLFNQCPDLQEVVFCRYPNLTGALDYLPSLNHVTILSGVSSANLYSGGQRRFRDIPDSCRLTIPCCTLADYRNYSAYDSVFSTIEEKCGSIYRVSTRANIDSIGNCDVIGVTDHFVDNYGRISGASGRAVEGSEVLLTAWAKPGYHFVRWSDGVTDSIRRQVVITSDTTFTALFAENGNSSIGEISASELHVSVFDGRIKVHSNSLNSTRIDVYDIMGRHITSFNATGHAHSVQLPTGIYIVRINNQHTEKVVITR